MKRILSTVLAITLLIGVAQAQAGSRGHHGKKGGDALKELNLTNDQKAKLKTIREAERTELQALKSDGKTEADREARKAIHEKYKVQLEAVLTAEQKAQLERQRGEMKEKIKDRRDSTGRGAKRGDNIGQQAAFFKKELNLSAEQEAKLKGIFQEYQTELEKVRSNTALTTTQKGEQVRSLGKQYMSKGKAVLNADQLKKLEDIRSKRKKGPAANV